MFTKIKIFLLVIALMAVLVGPVQAQFTNTTVSGLSIWLKADAGVFQTSGEVDIWSDQSGNTNDVWAPSTTNRPLITTATIGGSAHDVIRFDGTDDALTLASAPNGIPLQDHTAFFVTARTGGTASTRGNLFGFDKTGGRGSDGWYYKFTQGQVNMESGMGLDYGYKLAAGAANNTFLVGEGVFSTPDTTASLYVNGQLTDQNTACLTPLNEPAGTPFNLGAFADASGTGFTNFFQGDIGEILVYDRVLNTTERDTVRTYLSDKYGIAPYVPPEPLPLELKAKWSFENDGSDSVGNSHMNLGSEAVIATGKVGNGLSVSADPDLGFASTPADADLDLAVQFSTSMWLQYDEFNGPYARPISRLQDELNGYNIAFQNSDTDPTASQLVVRVKIEGRDYFATTNDDVLNQDQMHHVAFAYDELGGFDSTEKITLWIDGVESELTDTTGGGSVQGSADLVLGKGTATSSNYSGILDEVSFFTGLLTQDDIDDMVDIGSPELPGDANEDGSVDVTDLGILATNYGATSGMNWGEGDFTGDGAVDVSDLGILATNYGTSIESAAAVPEPSAFMMLLSIVLSLIMVRRR